MTTSPPPAKRSDEADCIQFRLAQEEGSAYAKSLEHMVKEVAHAGDTEQVLATSSLALPRKGRRINSTAAAMPILRTCHLTLSKLKPAGADVRRYSREVGMESRAVVGFARAFAGALIFALPMMMTMELWRLGFIVSPLKLALLFVVMLPLLTGLSWIGGFEPTSSRGDDIIDALVAVAIAASTSLAILWLFRIIEWGMPASEILGKRHYRPSREASAPFSLAVS